MATASPSSVSFQCYDISNHEAVEAIARCYGVSVKYSLLALVNFGGIEEEIALQSPAPGFTLNFSKGDYLHIKEEYNDDWMIGRVVGHESGVGFLPRKDLLTVVVKQRGEKDDTSKDCLVYKQAPILRPILIMGPSLKKYELTRLLQKGLVSHIQKQFTDRLVVIKLESPISSLSLKQASLLKKQIYTEGRNSHLVLLDCDASFPFEIYGLNIHPIFVYIQISQKKVLLKLIKEHCKNSAQREEQLQAAYQLYDLPPSNFSLVITDTNLEDAAQNFELFVESYWACTHPPVPHPSFEPDN